MRILVLWLNFKSSENNLDRYTNTTDKQQKGPKKIFIVYNCYKANPRFNFPQQSLKDVTFINKRKKKREMETRLLAGAVPKH